jgi:hypothetical protein
MGRLGKAAARLSGQPAAVETACQAIAVVPHQTCVGPEYRKVMGGIRLRLRGGVRSTAVKSNASFHEAQGHAVGRRFDLSAPDGIPFGGAHRADGGWRRREIFWRRRTQRAGARERPLALCMPQAARGGAQRAYEGSHSGVAVGAGPAGDRLNGQS